MDRAAELERYVEPMTQQPKPKHENLGKNKENKENSGKNKQ